MDPASMYLNSSSTLLACGDVIPSTSSTNELNRSCVPLLVVVEVGGTKGKPIKDGEVVKLKLVDDATTVDVTAGRLAGCKLNGVVIGSTLSCDVTAAKSVGVVTGGKLTGGKLAAVVTCGKLAGVVTGGKLTGGKLAAVVTCGKLAGVVTGGKLTGGKLAGVVTGGKLAGVITGGKLAGGEDDLVDGTSTELHPTAEVGVTNKIVPAIVK